MLSCNRKSRRCQIRRSGHGLVRDIAFAATVATGENPTKQKKTMQSFVSGIPIRSLGHCLIVDDTVQPILRKHLEKNVTVSRKQVYRYTGMYQ